MKTHQRKQTLLTVKGNHHSMDKILPSTMKATWDTARKSTATNIRHSYHPLQHDNLGSQIPAYSKNVDQP